jgi:uncharacterized protein with HEPN domain
MRQSPQDNFIYLSDILRCMENIANYTQSGEADFLQSQLLQDAVIRNFEIIGEATKHLSLELRQQYPEIPWRRMAGFRDILIHSYMSIDVSTVWQAVQELPPLKARIQSILETLNSEPPLF